MTPGQLSNDIYKIVDILISYTKEMLGATDAALGEVRPENTSAIIVLQKAASIPLKSISKRYYTFIEDKARIKMDFFLNKYNTSRTLTYKDNGITHTFEFDAKKLGDLQWRVKIDIGSSTHWSEVTAIQTLDNLLMQQHITFAEYLERLPNGIIPMREKLMQDRMSADLDKQVLYKTMGDFVQSLPPQAQQEITSLEPEEMEARVKQMIIASEERADQATQM